MKIKFTILHFIISIVALAQSAPAYYNSIDFSKTGNEMKAQLTSLITSTHTNVISYNEVRELIKTSDKDPNNPNNILLIYGSESSGTHQRSRSVNGDWNREHVYAKSKGTPNLGNSGPGADGHHIRPADMRLNSMRSNYSFDDGYGATAYRTSRGGWYPGDEWKGDVARIIMYMYVRYQNRAQPLNITFPPATYSSDFPDILLKWNVEDPVSEFEVQRNNIVANVQNNRNPFIDNPYLATVIWGGIPAENKWPNNFGDDGTPDEINPSVPQNLEVTYATDRSLSVQWDASTDNISVAGYDVYVDGEFYANVYTNNVVISGLQPDTTYDISVAAFDAAGNRSEMSETIQGQTTNTGEGGTGATCGVEDFENIPSTGGNPPASSYTNRTWTNNGIVWNATNARTDRQIYIDGDNDKSICIRKGSLTSSTISGGIGSLSVRTYLPFRDSDGYYTLKINGEVKGQIPYSDDPSTYTIENINVAGDFTIELVDSTTSNRVSFDDLSWTCYETLDVSDVTEESNEFKVYPNPITDNVFFVDGLSEAETLNIYNLEGKLVQTLKAVRNNQKLSLKNLPKGVYFINRKNQSTKVLVK
ncbi:endonuclease [Weeksellaceae bacterium KMM 9724]|uniref:endonuclease n=1 Tax=Profundicola chukchiensis TaxID=2961959 RepID=UPI002437B003|nr:endonuclease [Profundicola chukchiensis]MDG4950180.1 endonuclease [Profundicola chukchiensis]